MMNASAICELILRRASLYSASLYSACNSEYQHSNGGL